MAVGVASKHGVSQASLALRLDYYAVKRRLAATGGAPVKPSTTEFVELSMPATHSPDRAASSRSARSWTLSASHYRRAAPSASARIQRQTSAPNDGGF